MRLFLAALILMMGTIPAGAEWLDRPTPDIPRLTTASLISPERHRAGPTASPI